MAMRDVDHRFHAGAKRLLSACTRAGDERGDSLIEVVMAALIVALLAAAVFTGFSAVANIQGAERHQSVAISLADQDEQRLSGLSVQELVASASGSCTSTAPADGNGCYTQTIDNVTYTVTSTAKFYSASSGSLSCSTSGPAASADYIATTSEVTWESGGNDRRAPVEEHSLITPTSGGQIVASVLDSTVTPHIGVSGATVTVTGPGTSTATQTATTDMNGCAVFVGVTAGSYNVSLSLPSPYLSYGGTTTTSVSVTNGGTGEASFTAAQAATANATFQTTVNGGQPTAIQFDTFSLGATNQTPVMTFGTAGTYASQVSTGATLYPYLSGYDAYAGTCTADDPGSTHDTAFSPADGGTVTGAISVPSMLLALSTQSPGGTQTTNVDDTSSSITYAQGSGSSNGWLSASGQSWTSGDYDNTESYSDIGGNYATFTFSGTGIEWITSLDSNHGYADVYIDGTRVSQNVNLYAASKSYQHVGYSTSSLSNGTHTIKIVVDGSHAYGSSDSFVPIDEFIVTAPATAVTTPVSAWPSGWTIYSYDSCSTPVERTVATPTPIDPAGTWLTPVYAPYGNSVQVCVANTTTNTNTGTVPSGSTQLSNTDLTGRTTTALVLPTTSTATNSNAVFANSGACPG